ncbi:MAG: 2-oxo-4-hydroxy-4-carboxy-5-ureidoimidazoline decarboxylase [Paraglaciecola sp.]|jgi:2-oxo-4-hydroxy-4-carboxy-5-ureidoimidazoline decarboxylase
MNQQNTLSLQALNSLNSIDAEQWFSQCCAAPKWFKGLTQARPFSDYDAVVESANKIWQQCSTPDFLTAFEAHPMIGDVNSLRKKYAATKNMASNEQQGAADADEKTLHDLASANHEYLNTHGFIFIICASGLSAETMLQALNLRLNNDTATEIVLAATEQIKITLLRLEKGLEKGLENTLEKGIHTS